MHRALRVTAFMFFLAMGVYFLFGLASWADHEGKRKFRVWLPDGTTRVEDVCYEVGWDRGTLDCLGADYGPGGWARIEEIHEE